MTQRSLVDSDQLALARATTYAADPAAQAAFMHGFRSQWAQLMAHRATLASDEAWSTYLDAALDACLAARGRAASESDWDTATGAVDAVQMATRYVPHVSDNA